MSKSTMKRVRYQKMKKKYECDHCNEDKIDVEGRHHCPIWKSTPYLCNDCYIKVIEKNKEKYADSVIYKLRHGRYINES